MNVAPDSVELQPRRRGYACEAQQPGCAPASQKSGGSAAVPSEEPIMRFQSSDKRIPINAFQAQALIRSRAEDTTRMAKLSEHAPKDRSAVLVLVEGLGHHQWRVALGCALSLGGAKDGASEAVAGLQRALSHSESSVRGDAAGSLALLTQHADIDLDVLWQAYQCEDDMPAFLEMGKALLAALEKPQTPPPHLSETVRDMLEQISVASLTHLPLGGESQLFPTPESLSGPRPSLVTRLMTITGLVKPEPSPRLRKSERGCFLEPKADRWEDYPEVISGLAAIYAALPVSDPDRRQELVLKLCKLPLSYHVTTQRLVLVAAGLAKTPKHRATVIAGIREWGGGSHETKASRLAHSVAQAYPDWRTDLFTALLDIQAGMDWTNWAYSLKSVPTEELTPLLEAMKTAPEKQWESWFKLFDEAPVAATLEAIVQVLECSNAALVRSALRRLRAYGQPLPSLSPLFEKLKERWSDESDILELLGEVEGQTKAVGAVDGPLPEGLREPRLMVEWTLDETARTPFSPDKPQAWGESLNQVRGLYVQGGPFYLFTSEKVVVLNTQGPPGVSAVPPEVVGTGFQFLCAGPAGELFLNGPYASQVDLYLLTPQKTHVQRLTPPIPDDEAPKNGDLMGDGKHFGWSKTVWKMSHFESDPGHDEHITYRLQPASGRLEKLKGALPPGMVPVSTDSIYTCNYSSSPLSFSFSKDGAFRICETEGLAIKTTAENPVHSSGRADGKLALHLEVFPSRTCRLYLWDRREGATDLSEIDAMVANLSALS